MLRVMIVDDDILVRNNLRMMIDWEARGYCLCGEAADGGEAVTRVDALCPEIVILDMNMPVMDGVALSQYIFQHHPDTGILVLSSYDDYAYMRGTMKNGAVDYLLKHQLNAEELLRALNKASEKSLSAQRRHKAEKQSRELLDQARKITGMQQIREILRGSADATGDPDTEAMLFRDGRRVVVSVMQITNIWALVEQYADKEQNQLVSSVTNLCQQLLGEDDSGMMLYLAQGRYALLSFFEKPASEGHIQSAVHRQTGRLTRTLQKYVNVAVVWGNSPPCQRMDGLYRACAQAEATLDSLLDSTHSAAVSPAEKRREPELFSLSINQEKRMLAAIEAGDVSSVQHIIDEAFDTLARSAPSFLCMQMLISELVTIAGKVEHANKGLVSRGDAFEQLKRETVSSNYSMQRIRDLIKLLFAELLSDIQQGYEKNDCSPYIRKAMEYIGQHYARDISLNDVAGSIGISPQYLSQLCKKELGTGFNEHLNRVRVRAAMNLIRNGETRMKEVYGRVGFNNYNYFFKVFKDIVGCTPACFLKEKGENG